MFHRNKKNSSENCWRSEKHSPRYRKERAILNLSSEQGIKNTSQAARLVLHPSGILGISAFKHAKMSWTGEGPTSSTEKKLPTIMNHGHATEGFDSNSNPIISQSIIVGKCPNSHWNHKTLHESDDLPGNVPKNTENPPVLRFLRHPAHSPSGTTSAPHRANAPSPCYARRVPGFANRRRTARQGPTSPSWGSEPWLGRYNELFMDILYTREVCDVSVNLFHAHVHVHTHVHVYVYDICVWYMCICVYIQNISLTWFMSFDGRRLDAAQRPASGLASYLGR